MVSLQMKPNFLKPNDDLSLISENNEQVTSFVFNVHHPFSIVEQRERLPIRKYRDQILYSLEKNQVLILVGETGCGKSTQVPQYLYEWGWHHKGIIGVTEPRRTAAITLAQRVAYECGEEIENTVGFVIGLVEQQSISTKIKYMTEGILLREMLTDPLLLRYSVIMIDEVHERNLLTDTLLSLLKKILKKRLSLKLIISSATTDAVFFKKFFDCGLKSKDASSVILSVEGRMHPIKIYYLNEPCINYLMKSVETVLQIHKKEAQGDILVFLTGQNDVLQAFNLMNEYINSEKLQNIQIFQMYGTLPVKEQIKAFLRPPKNFRKVIFSTNIAETCVTIPGVVYVVDCGFTKVKWLHLESATNSLVVLPISKATAVQRAGRAGRLTTGKVYRLYTEAEFKNFPDRIPPEIRRSDISSVILLLKALGINNILRFDFVSSPPIENIQAVLETLYTLNAIDENCNLTNPVGYTLAEMPFDPMLSKILYISGQMGCSEEILSIVAMLQVPSVFSKPISGQGQIKARIAKRRFEVAEGDLITLLNVYTAFIENNCTKEFCGKNYLIYRHLKHAYLYREEIAKKVLKKLNIPITSAKGNVQSICKCIVAGLFLNAAYLHHSGVYRKIHGDTELFVSPQSSLYTLPQSKFVVYYELLQTTKFFMDHIIVIKGEWLSELAPHYYHKASIRH